MLHIWTDSTYPAYLEAGQQKRKYKIKDNGNIVNIPNHHFGSSYLTLRKVLIFHYLNKSLVLYSLAILSCYFIQLLFFKHSGIVPIFVFHSSIVVLVCI